MALDIDLFKSQLNDILTKRNEIVNSSMADEEKENALRVLASENDELNQSLDIYFRLVDFSSNYDITKLSQLLADFESGSVDLLSKFTPDLYSAVMSKFSSNTGLSLSEMAQRQEYQVNNNDELYQAYYYIPVGSSASFSFLSDITLQNFYDDKKDLYLSCSGHNVNLGTYIYSDKNRPFNLGSSHKGSKIVSFRDANIFCDTKLPIHSLYTGHFTVIYSPLVLNLILTDINLGEQPFFANQYGYCAPSHINLNTVNIRRQSGTSGYFIRTNTNSNITLSIKNVILEDGLTWEDIIDDVSKVTFI